MHTSRENPYPIRAFTLSSVNLSFGKITLGSLAVEAAPLLVPVLVEAGAASTPLAPPKLTYGKLESGSMMVFAAASPLDLHLSTGTLFGQYSDTVYPAVEEAGEKGNVQKEVTLCSLYSVHSSELALSNMHLYPSGDGWISSARSRWRLLVPRSSVHHYA